MAMTTQEASRCALITGASSGIGAAFAHILASRKVDLVLTARRTERLTLLAYELSEKYAIRVETIIADLADPMAPQRLYNEIVQRKLSIDILINNAGYGLPGHFHTQPWFKHADFIQVLMTAPCQLAHLFLPGMRQRDFGRIINVASLAGHLPGTVGQSLYAAAKAFLIRFSQSLALENQYSQIHVTALCPGFTYSEFHDVTKSRALVSKLPAWLWMSAEDVARQGLDAVERGDIVYTNGAINRLIKLFFKLLPDYLALKLIAKRSKDFRTIE